MRAVICKWKKPHKNSEKTRTEPKASQASAKVTTKEVAKKKKVSAKPALCEAALTHLGALS